MIHPLHPSHENVVGEYALWGERAGWSLAIPIPATDIVNDWVYHDGWLGSAAQTWNVECTSASAKSCNGHRRAVLSRSPVPGATLYIDIATRHVPFEGTTSIEVSGVARLACSRATHAGCKSPSEARSLNRYQLPRRAFSLRW